MSRSTSGIGITFLAAVGLAAAPAAQQSIGMAVAANNDVVVFDADADTVLGVVDLPPSLGCSDCAVTADLTLGFVVDFQFQVWVIDLTASPPELAGGTNPIPISNNGEDITISPDQQYLIVCDGGATQPVSVVDIAARSEIGTFSLGVGSTCNSVEACSDGSVLVTTTSSGGTVRRLTLDGAGTLTDTGDNLLVGGAFDGPNNTACAPSAATGVVLMRGAAEMRSFTIPGLAQTDTQPLASSGVAAVIHPDGDRIYAISAGTEGPVESFDYDSASGLFGASVFTAEAGFTTTCFGVDLIAIHPDGSRLYTSAPDLVAGIQVLDADTGEPITTIEDPVLDSVRGICVAQAAECFLVVGKNPGNEAFDAGGHSWPTQLSQIMSSYPVTMQNIPAFEIPAPSSKSGNFMRQTRTKVQELAVQVLMWNPQVFPENPEQWTEGLDVTVWSDGRVTARPFGESDGMSIELATYTADGRRYVRFPFGIDGFEN